MIDKERQDIKMATLYELRLIFTTDEKTEYTTEEIVALIDKLAMEENIGAYSSKSLTLSDILDDFNNSDK